MNFVVGSRRFGPDEIALMGVVNVTPDSFSDGGRFLSAERAIEYGLALVSAGAHVLDIGGESTRPGAESVSEADELARVIPVIEGLRRHSDAILSIDTTKAAVARAACAAGAGIINDISGLKFEPEIAHVAAEAGASLCLMHIQGEPRTMQDRPVYRDVVSDVIEALKASVDTAVTCGVDSERIIVDPGIGFGKRLADNLALIARCGEIGDAVGAPVLMGVSRKSFIGELTGQPVDKREFGTAAAVAVCVIRGARMLRVHDVAAMRDVVAVTRALTSEMSRVRSR
ncbi:MAG: dihydropteroate synthase [Myxococcota bacterium]|jgi:dihydropteroate synthase